MYNKTLSQFTKTTEPGPIDFKNEYEESLIGQVALGIIFKPHPNVSILDEVI